MTRKIVNRGTAVQIEKCPPKSSGALYQKCQQENMAVLPGNLLISTKRGTSSMKALEYPKVENNVPNWGFITSARGTSRRHA